MVALVKSYLIRNAKKVDIIREIEKEDEAQGHFFSDGRYRYGVKFYYGDLRKYDKKKLVEIWSRLIKTRER